MSWDYLPKKDRMPAPSESKPESLAIHELARKKRAHKKCMTTLGRVLLASALQCRVADLPMEKIIVSVEPLAFRCGKAKPKKVVVADSHLELL